jgi:hypothetical protein
MRLPSVAPPELIQKRPDRFAGVAGLPLSDVDSALRAVYAPWLNTIGEQGP